MDHKIIGTTMPVLEVSLQHGEAVVAEGGELSWMTSPIELHTAASGTAGSKGVFGAVKRAVSGGTFFMTEYSAVGAPGMVAFATKVPGHIKPIELDGSRQYMVHRGGVLGGVPGVERGGRVLPGVRGGVLGGGRLPRHTSTGRGCVVIC